MHILLSVILLFIIVMIITIITINATNNNIVNNRIPFKSDVKEIIIPYTFYWINLDSAEKRRIDLLSLFKKYNIKNNRINAIKGGPSDYDKELACSKSHIKAVTTFYDSGEDIGIICEDDLTMEYKKYWRKNLQDVIQDAPKDWEILQISLTSVQCIHGTHICTTFPLGAIKHHTKEYIPYIGYFSSALCYIINRKGAKKIVESRQPITNMIEHWMFMQVKTYTYRYPMFTYPSNNDSYLHQSHLYGHQLSKDVITDYLKYK
jgi:GR25 family glycosyltransferase involved in LPS biosynthesis